LPAPNASRGAIASLGWGASRYRHRIRSAGAGALRDIAIAFARLGLGRFAISPSHSLGWGWGASRYRHRIRSAASRPAVLLRGARARIRRRSDARLLAVRGARRGVL